MKYFTKGTYPYFYIEQYDDNGKLTLLKKADETKKLITNHYRDGILNAKNYTENKKDITEYYEKGKLVGKEISYLKNGKLYLEHYKNGKLIKTDISDIEEKKEMKDSY